MDKHAQNEIESLVEVQLNKMEAQVDQIREVLSLSRQKPNSGLHSTLILEYPNLAKMYEKLAMIKNELTYFFKYDTDEIPYGDS